MGKRIKKVFSSPDQVLHLWANQTQSDARSANVYFEGKSCFSYGSHYELGRLVEFNGKTVAVINDTGYSVTTAKHIRSAERAVAHLPTVCTKGDFSKNCVEAGMIRRQGEIAESLASHFSSRSFWSGATYKQCEAETVEQFNALCDTLGFKELKLNVTPEFIADYDAHVVACVEKKAAREALKNTPEEIARREREAQKRVERAARKNEESVQAWRNGGASNEYIRDLFPQIIRVLTHIDDGSQIVQTSRGAEVPMSHALRLLAMIKRGGVKSGERVGHFTVDGLTTLNSAAHEREQAIKIGCHTIALSEAETVLGDIKPTLSLVG